MDANRLLTESAIQEARWSKTGLLDGITDDWTRKTTAVILENQRLGNQRFLNEASTSSADVANFKKISIPLIRRIYPNLIANKIVGVQPLLGPVGLVYYLRFRYSSNKGSTRGGAGATVGFPTDDALSLQQNAAGDTSLDIHYASQFINNETQANAGGSGFATLAYQMEKTPMIAGSLTGVIYDGSTAVYNFSINSSGTFSLTAIGSPGVTITAGSCTINHDTGVMTLAWASDPGANSVIVSYEYKQECNQDLPEINLALESEEVVAKRRQLKAVWSFDAEQDLRSQHSLDMQGEVTNVLAQEINTEIDREIITDLRNNAGTISAWDLGAALGTNIKEKYESLFVKVSELSAVVHRKTLRGSANFIVCSPEVATIFETASAGFAPAPSESFTSSLGVQYVGSISSRWKLYKDPHFPINQLLLGYKGDSYMDSGYFHMPYVPLTLTPVVYDPESLCPRVGLLTRYGKKLLRDGAKFYSRLSIHNFSV